MSAWWYVAGFFEVVGLFNLVVDVIRQKWLEAAINAVLLVWWVAYFLRSRRCRA